MTEPWGCEVESGDASAEGVRTLLEQTAEFMEDREGRYTLLIEIEERESADA